MIKPPEPLNFFNLDSELIEVMYQKGI